MAWGDDGVDLLMVVVIFAFGAWVVLSFDYFQLEAM